MSIHNVRLNVTTASNGAGSATSEGPVLGYLEMVDWIDGTFADGVDGTLTTTLNSSGTAHTLLTLTDANNDAVYYPRRVVDTTAGAAATGVYNRFLIDGYLVLTIAQGGDTKTGGMVVYYATE